MAKEKEEKEEKEVQATPKVNPRVEEIEQEIAQIQAKRIYWATYANKKEYISSDLKRTLDDIHEKTERELGALRLELNKIKGVK